MGGGGTNHSSARARNNTALRESLCKPWPFSRARPWQRSSESTAIREGERRTGEESALGDSGQGPNKDPSSLLVFETTSHYVAQAGLTLRIPLSTKHFLLRR